MEKFKTFAGSLSLLATLSLMFLNLGATAPTGVAPSHTKSPFSHSLVPHVANPHLHGAVPAILHARGKTHIARHWVGRWSFAEWATLHRGLGNITGKVRTAAGSPAAGARVALRGARGRTLARVSARHITQTSAAGVFIMHNVRIGNYRVRANHGKAAGATPVHVSGGRMSTVAIRI